MRPTKLFLLLLVTLTACSERASQQLVTGKWLERQAPYFPKRLPAQVAPTSAPAAQCKRDLFTVEGLRAEAQHYEALLEGGERPRGSWKHLQFADIPVAQARFLRTLGEQYGDLNHPENYDFSACRDVPCIVNTVYGANADIEGWVTYIWWLRMGSLISFKNKINDGTIVSGYTSTPREYVGTYNGIAYPLDHYLFDKDELYALWRIAEFMPAQYRALTNLKEVQRIPRGSLFMDVAGLPSRRGACGLAWSSGTILLQDGCLSFERPNLDRGDIYHSIPHEMSHMVDYLRSSDQGLFYFSREPFWINEGKWTLAEHLDTATGTVVQQWQTTLPPENFISGYARTNPMEHFADTLSYYRYNGAASSEKVPATTYNWVKSNIYEEQEFTVPGMYAYLRKFEEQDLTPRVFSAAMACFNDSSTFTSGPALAASAFSLATEDNLRRCLWQKRSELLSGVVEDVKLNDVDGCEMLRTPERVTGFRAEMDRWVQAQFAEHIQKALEDQHYFEQLAGFYQEMERASLPVQIYTDCYGESDERACYQQKIRDYLDRSVADSVANAQRLRIDLAKRFTDTFPFDLVRSQTLKTFQDFIAAQGTGLQDAGLALWNECKEGEVSNAQAPVSGPFSVGQGWMVSSQFNCLNSKIEERLTQVVSGMSLHGEQVSSEKEQRILRDVSRSSFVAELNSQYQAAREEELQQLQQATGGVVGIKARLMANFAWARPFSTSYSQQCREQALSSVAMNYHYLSLEQIRAQGQTACDQVLASPEWQTYLRAHPEFSVDFHVSRYVQGVRDWARAKSQACDRQYPARGYIAKLRKRGVRGRCFDSDWLAVSARLLAQAQTEYHFQLPPDAYNRMREEGNRVYRQVKGDLLGEVIPDIGI